MFIYHFIIDIFNRYPSLYYGLPIWFLVLLLLPLAIPFFWTLAQHLSEKYWRYEDRAKALEYAFSQIRPNSKAQRYFNRYLNTIFILDLVFVLFVLVHGTKISELLTPERTLIWGVVFCFRFFIKRMKESLQDKMKSDLTDWVRNKLNDILATCSDFFVLSFIGDRPNCEAFFDKIFIFPEAKQCSLSVPHLGPLFFDPFHLNGAALVEDSSLFIFEGKENIVIHTKCTLRNLLKLQYKPSIAESDEDFQALLSGLPYHLMRAKTHDTTWDCVKQVLATNEDEQDSVAQYQRTPFEKEIFDQYMPYMKGVFTTDIPRVELFPEYVTKMRSSQSSLELFWHDNAGAPTWIPLYPRDEGDSITDRLQNLVRKHKRAKLADKTITNHLDEHHIVTPDTEAHQGPEQALELDTTETASTSVNLGKTPAQDDDTLVSTESEAENTVEPET